MHAWGKQHAYNQKTKLRDMATPVHEAHSCTHVLLAKNSDQLAQEARCVAKTCKHTRTYLAKRENSLLSSSQASVHTWSEQWLPRRPTAFISLVLGDVHQMGKAATASQPIYHVRPLNVSFTCQLLTSSSHPNWHATHMWSDGYCLLGKPSGPISDSLSIRHLLIGVSCCLLYHM